MTRSASFVERLTSARPSRRSTIDLVAGRTMHRWYSIERDAQLALLRSLLPAGGGSGHLALVAGEAGIGKTALITAFAAEYATRGRVLWGTCDPIDPPRPFAPVADVAAHIGGPLLTALGAGDRSRVFDAFLEVLRRRVPGPIDPRDRRPALGRRRDARPPSRRRAAPERHPGARHRRLPGARRGRHASAAGRPGRHPIERRDRDRDAGAVPTSCRLDGGRYRA